MATTEIELGGRRGLPMFVRNILRRRSWLFGQLKLSRFRNLLGNARAFLFKQEQGARYPTVLKVDISPLCNLRCTVCVHAEPKGNEVLKQQHFERSQVMTVPQFQRIIDEVASKVSSVSLYYLGDPLMHPELARLSEIASAAGLGVHISTNFSFRLSDDKIRELVRCGLSHITVCVDGMTQDTYARTRVGGDIRLVMENLKRLCAYRGEIRSQLPEIEVQYLKYRHNLHELPLARKLFAELGVDQVTTNWGFLHNYTDVGVDRLEDLGPQAEAVIPTCHFPYHTMIIRYDGKVIPCCLHRHGEQYTAESSPRVLGNVFETSVAEVWNSSAYRSIRRYVSNPQLANQNQEYARSFCAGCRRVARTNHDSLVRHASEHDYETLYKDAPRRKLPLVHASRRPRTSCGT